ncbi:hypothetical protein FisN_10Lh152 [Fistulifera solaris]|uniref:Sulfotransferase family protein n=1 Tax=Fistulifera solaris TaxID=1519565 RepID=A0A1Z5JTC8_FISSO|nr:hypothetical protein FisN_10Lh152 [Fistulifera solaris]|eukprot:GAX17293.1 hypothetical protein FisN_10Lh152 [Fistulifera solaris]
MEVDPAELDAARTYIRSIKRFGRALKFLHIPKNAGSAIEEVAGGARPQYWGGCLFKHKPKRKSCVYPPGGWWPEHVAWWHIPSQFFPLENVDPYADADVFAVLREPLDRILSEFYYVCSLRHEDWRPYQCDEKRLFEPEYLNDWLQRKIQAQPQTPSAERYLMDFGHFTPQSEFIFGPNEVRMVDFVLFMDDSFDRSFDQLMAAFGLSDIKIKKFNALGAKERTVDTHLNVTHLDRQTLSVFNSRYAEDFALFNTTLEVR